MAKPKAREYIRSVIRIAKQAPTTSGRPSYPVQLNCKSEEKKEEGIGNLPARKGRVHRQTIDALSSNHV